MKYKLSIIGGSSGFGKWLAEYVLREYGQYCEIMITGGDPLKAQRVAKELGVFAGSSNKEALRDADIAIFSAPISKTQAVIEECISYIKEGAVIADVTSIKGFPSLAMRRCKQKNICVIPTHPMFGPYLNSIAGQVVVLTPSEAEAKHPAYLWLSGELKKQKAQIIETTPEMHDKMMAVVQGLTHLNMFTLGRTLEKLNFDAEFSLNFVSPIYKLMLSSVGRYLSQSPWLYADIQMYNSQIASVQASYKESVSEFQKLCESENAQGFCDLIDSAAEHMGADVTQRGQRYTDKVIALITQQVEKAKKSIGNTLTLQDIYSSEHITIELESFEKDYLRSSSGESYHIDQYIIL